MGPRNGAIALVLAASLASAAVPPQTMVAEPVGTQGATEVTVDLSEIGVEDRATVGALAQTADPHAIEALALGGAGLLAGGAGCLLCRPGRSHADDGDENT